MREWLKITEVVPGMPVRVDGYGDCTIIAARMEYALVYAKSAGGYVRVPWGLVHERPDVKPIDPREADACPIES